MTGFTGSAGYTALTRCLHLPAHVHVCIVGDSLVYIPRRCRGDNAGGVAVDRRSLSLAGLPTDEP